MGNVFVTNTNDFVHEDRYNGEDFIFPPNQAVLCSEVAANHMFGYGQPDKSDTLVRLGWAMMYDTSTKRMVENPDGVKKLARFIFEEAVTVARSKLAPPSLA